MASEKVPNHFDLGIQPFFDFKQKFFRLYHLYGWERDARENIVMFVIGNDEFCPAIDRTVYELIIVNIRVDEVPFIIQEIN